MKAKVPPVVNNSRDDVLLIAVIRQTPAAISSW